MAKVKKKHFYGNCERDTLKDRYIKNYIKFCFKVIRYPLSQTHKYMRCFLRDMAGENITYL